MLGGRRHDEQINVMFVGGPNERLDFHLEEGEEVSALYYSYAESHHRRHNLLIVSQARAYASLYCIQVDFRKRVWVRAAYPSLLYLRFITPFLSSFPVPFLFPFFCSHLFPRLQLGGLGELKRVPSGLGFRRQTTSVHRPTVHFGMKKIYIPLFAVHEIVSSAHKTQAFLWRGNEKTEADFHGCDPHNNFAHGCSMPPKTPRTEPRAPMVCTFRINSLSLE